MTIGFLSLVISHLFVLIFFFIEELPVIEITHCALFVFCVWEKTHRGKQPRRLPVEK